MSEKGIMHIELKKNINKYDHPKHFELVTFVSSDGTKNFVTLSEDDIGDSLKLWLPWHLSGFHLDFAPKDPRKVGFISTWHPKIYLELERYRNHWYELKNGWSSVVRAENFKNGDRVSLWTYRDDVTNTLCFAIQHLEGSGSNF